MAFRLASHCAVPVAATFVELLCACLHERAGLKAELTHLVGEEVDLYDALRDNRFEVNVRLAGICRFYDAHGTLGRDSNRIGENQEHASRARLRNSVRDKRGYI